MKKILLILFLIPALSFAQRGMMSGGINPDAQTFIVATGITSPTEIYASNILLQTTKLIGLWTNMKCLYPLVGGTSTSCKWNLKDPRDLDAAFRLVFTGSPTFSANGMALNASSQYADPKFTPSTGFSSVNAGTMGYYSRTNVTTGSEREMGVDDATSVTRLIIYLPVNTFSYGDMSEAGTTYGAVVTDTRGLFTATRTGASATEIWKNSTSLGTRSSAATSRPTARFVIGAQGGTGTSIIAYSGKQCAFAFIYDGGFNQTQMTNFYNTIQDFQTKLARQL